MTKKTKKNIVWFGSGIVIILLCLFLVFFVINRRNSVRQNRMPIVFVSNLDKTSKVIDRVETSTSRNGGELAIKVNVYPNGKTYYHANKNVYAEYPIIQVNFKDGKATTSHQASELNRILVQLNNQYDYEQYDAIGFSAGSLAVYENATQYGPKENHMSLNRFISIAGPYKGVLPKRGNTNNQFPSFQHFENNPLPKNVNVLNVVGDISKKDKTDGKVSMASATSLGRLVSKDKYQQLTIHGKKGKHYKLLDNENVQMMTGRFLFVNN